MSAQSGSGGRSLWMILRVPLAIFAATVGGLAAALLGEGAWHWLAWVMLSAPIAIILAAIIAPRRGS